MDGQLYGALCTSLNQFIGVEIFSYFFPNANIFSIEVSPRYQIIDRGTMQVILWKLWNGIEKFNLCRIFLSIMRSWITCLFRCGIWPSVVFYTHSPTTNTQSDCILIWLTFWLGNWKTYNILSKLLKIFVYFLLAASICYVHKILFFKDLK